MHSVQNIHRTLALFTALVPASAFALPITIEWEAHVTHKFDFAAGTYDTSFQEIVANGSQTFENTVTAYVDYGLESHTYFGDLYGTTWNSPITQFIAPSPFGGGTNSGTSYTVAYSDDYPSSFVEGVVSQSNAYIPSQDGSQFWSYHLEIRPQQYSSSQGGLGTADYAFTPDSLVSFYQEFKDSGQHVLFNEYYDIFDVTNKSYLGGYSWSGYAIITNIISDQPTQVPEPSTMLLFLAGLSAASLTRRLTRTRIPLRFMRAG